MITRFNQYGKAYNYNPKVVYEEQADYSVPISIGMIVLSIVMIGLLTIVL